MLMLSRPRRMTIPTVAMVALSLAACSSAPPTPGTMTRAMPSGSTGAGRGGNGLEITVRNDGQAENLAAPPADVYAAVVGAYVDLAIPTTRQDPDTRVVGNDGLKMRRQLGKIEMRRAFDCGGTSGMPNSETYQILATIVSSVQPDGSNAVMTTVINATAENPSYPGSGVRCSSTGVLEAAIAKQVRTRLNAR